MSIASVGSICASASGTPSWNRDFDPSHPENIRWVTVHQAPTSSIQDIHAVSENEVLVAHDQGFSLVDISSGKVKANYMFGERGLPFYFGRDLRIAMVNHSSMLFSHGSEVVFSISAPDGDQAAVRRKPVLRPISRHCMCMEIPFTSAPPKASSAFPCGIF